MNFFKALELLEKDLKHYLGMEVPDTVASGLQFSNIMQEFLENVQNTSDNKDCAEFTPLEKR
jgi:hypothetical protein